MNTSVIVTNDKQLNIALNNKNVNEIIIDRDAFLDDDISQILKSIKAKSKLALVRFERVSRYDYISDLKNKSLELLADKNLDGAVVQNFDSLILILNNLSNISNDNFTIEIDYGINVLNKNSKEYIKQLFDEKKKDVNKNIKLRFVSPVELNSYELRDLQIDTLIVYGYIPTMTSANCIFKTLDNCRHRDSMDLIRDRLDNNIYFRSFCKYCYNKIYNIYPLYLIDILNTLADIGFDKIRYDLSIEPEDEVKKILGNDYKIKNFTRGHIKNKIL